MTTHIIIDKKEVFLILGFAACIGAAFHFDKEGNLPKKSEEFLKKYNYTAIQIGEQYNHCPSKTRIRREFIAINPKGQQVEGFLCAENYYHKDKIETKLISQKNKPKL